MVTKHADFSRWTHCRNRLINVQMQQDACKIRDLMYMFNMSSAGRSTVCRSNILHT